MKIPLCIPSIDQEELDAVAETISSGWLCHGQKNGEFEEAFCKFVGVEHAISMNSCTSALQLAVECAEIKGEVIVPSFTWIASANAIISAGATPVFADIDETTYCIDPKSIESLISPQTEAIMPVHYAGQAADMKTIMAIAEKHSLHVIEDSAETIGGEHHSQQAGSFGTGCFSFFPTKNITVGEGGMLTTNDKGLAERVRSVMAHGLESTTHDREKVKRPWRRVASRVGYNYRLTNFQAAMGTVQMKKLDGMNNQRIQNAELYNHRLSSADGVII
ncbi:MAG: DegT/DnrJ/EryC1/StrS family aminotransferase, partial [Opitutales bacterium]